MKRLKKQNLPANERKSHLKRASQIAKSFAKTIRDIHFDENISKTIDLFVKIRNNGKIITTGMGKAGIVMRNFSSLLCSLGCSSAYLHPGEASHGDLGLLTHNDVLFVASTSGKTREILDVINLAKKIGIKHIIAITSHKDSPVRKLADITIDMGEIREEGHLGLAPTTSTIVMMAITNIISIITSEIIDFSLSEYGLYHHSGYIGRQAKLLSNGNVS